MMVKHTICPSCSVGCGINLINQNEKIVGTYPYKRHPVNEGKNCLRGRDCFEIVSENRITSPLVRKGNELVDSEWETILEMISEKLKSYSPKEIGILGSGNSTNEENETIKKFAESYGITNIGFFAENFPQFNDQVASYDDLNNSKFIFIIGDVLNENPLIGRRIILAKENGAEIISADTVDVSTTSLNSDQYFKFDSISELISNIPVEIKEKLNDSSTIVFNKLDEKEEFSVILEIANEFSSKILPVLNNCNASGAMKIISPLNNEEIRDLISKIKVLIVINDDPASYLENSSLSGLDFLVSITSSSNDTTSISDAVLPAYCWAEKSGSFTNTAGMTQNFSKIVVSPENTLSESVIIEKLAEKLGIEL